MAIHSPACETYLAELLTTPNDSVDHRMAGVISRLSERRARDYLITVMVDRSGTHAADIAREIYRRAADTTENEEAAR